MRRFAAVAPLLLLAMAWALPSLSAQRGGGHGGSSGHSASSFHGGLSGSGPAFRGGFSGPGPAFHGNSPGRFAAPSRSGVRTLPAYNFRVPWASEFNGQPRYAAGRTASAAPGFAHTTPGAAFNHSGFADHGRHRMPYRREHRDRDDFLFGGIIVPWWLNSYGYFGYPNFYQYPPWWDYDDSADSQANAPQGPPPQDYNGQPPPEQPDPASLPPWPSIDAPQNYAQSQPPAQVSAPQPSEPVTLVFNDGRPAEQIHNYLLTSGTLYVLDQQRQEIPVAELDLEATTKVNRKAGVEFHLPGR